MASTNAFNFPIVSMSLASQSLMIGKLEIWANRRNATITTIPITEITKYLSQLIEFS